MSYQSIVKGISFILLIWVCISCEKDEVNSLKFNKTSMSINVGKSDTLKVDITFSGDLSALPIEFTISDSAVVSITEGNVALSSAEKGGTVYSKNFFIKALKGGVTTLSVKSGHLQLSCLITVEQKRVTFQKAYAYNWGDFYDTNTNNIELLLLQSGLSFDASEKIKGTGYMLYMDMFGAITQNTLDVGEYFPADDGRPFSFFKGELVESNQGNFSVGSKILYYVNSIKTSEYLIADGSLVVASSGANRSIVAEFLNTDGEILQIDFNGLVTNEDKREAPEDIKPVLTKGLLYFLGDIYSSKTANTFIAYLGAESVNFSDSIISGDLLAIEFNTSLTIKDSIPLGNYTLMPELTYKYFIQGSIIPGYITSEGRLGTWFYGENDKKIKTGSMQVQKNGTMYTLKYEFYDRFGTKVSGTYNNTLAYIDATQPSSGVNSISKIKRQDKKLELKSTLVRKKHLCFE